MASYATYPSLKDKAVFVSGGGSGIGASIVENFCAQGSKVAFVDVAKEESEKLVKDLAGRKLPAPLFIHCDITDTAALQRAISDAKAKLGAFRVLVNNAAHDQRHAIDEVTPKYWDERIAVNLKHQFFAAQAVYKDMAAAGGGSIVNFGSISWMKKQGNMPVYTTSKSAVPRSHLRAGPRPRTDEHPGQYGRAWLDHDRAAAQAVADAGGRGRPDERPMHQAQAGARRHRPHGVVPGLR